MSCWPSRSGPGPAAWDHFNKILIIALMTVLALLSFSPSTIAPVRPTVEGDLTRPGLAWVLTEIQIGDLAGCDWLAMTDCDQNF